MKFRCIKEVPDGVGLDFKKWTEFHSERYAM